MGGFAPPIPQDDSNWEIRVAVLLSLFFQIVLIFVGPIRKRSSSPVLSFLIWSCYILADWVADLALGLLLNNMGNIGGKSSSSSTIALVTNPDNSPIIFAFWTPFLLLHLGGPDTITAYSIEDNQVWLRHLIGFLFELFSASVIFFCSLKGNPMIPATVLMFIVGIIKYGERTYSLYSGSVNGFRENIVDPPEPGQNYARLMTEFDSKERAGLDVEIVISGTDDEAMKGLDALEEGEAMRLVERSRSMEEQAFYFFLIFRHLFANVTLGYKELKLSQAYFLERDELRNSPAMAFKIIEIELNLIYDMMYTKGPITHSKAGLFLRFIASACLVSSLLVFFFRGDKGSFTRVDIAITYALLLGGVGLDTTALAMLISSLRMLIFLDKMPWLWRLARAIKTVRERLRPRRWSERISQLNLLSYCLGGNHHPLMVRALARVAKTLHIQDIFHDFFFIRHERLHCRQGQEPQKSLLKFMFDGACASAKNLRYKDAREAKNLYYEDMKEACSLRGQKVLKELRDEIVERLRWRQREDAVKMDENLAVLTSSVEMEFDESLVMWHIATDLCCYPVEHTALTKTASNMRSIGVTLSEYMLYLLIKQPEMLPPGNGLFQYRDTCAEAKQVFKCVAWEPDHAGARRMLLSVNTTKNLALMKGNRCRSVLFRGVVLSKVLRELGEDLMWEVVARVWGEMLAYAAGKCRGSTHVRQLSHGGELITMVWFLMAHMGLGDMYEINERDGVAKLIIRGQ